MAFQTPDRRWRVDVRTTRGGQTFEVRHDGGLRAVLRTLPELAEWLREHAGLQLAELEET